MCLPERGNNKSILFFNRMTQQYMKQFDVEELLEGQEVMETLTSTANDVLKQTGNGIHNPKASIFYVGDEAKFMQLQFNIIGAISPFTLKEFEKSGLGLPFVTPSIQETNTLQLSFMDEISKLVNIQHLLDLYQKTIF
jgi:hypothetical protein